MDTTEFSEGQYLTAILVKNSPTKVCVVIDEAMPEKTEFGNKLQATVQLDGKMKIWRLNPDSVRNMHQISKDSKFWVGKQVQLLVTTSKGKEVVIGTPVMPMIQSTNTVGVTQ